MHVSYAWDNNCSHDDSTQSDHYFFVNNLVEEALNQPCYILHLEMMHHHNNESWLCSSYRNLQEVEFYMLSKLWNMLVL